MNETSYRAPARGPTPMAMTPPKFIGYAGGGRHGSRLLLTPDPAPAYPAGSPMPQHPRIALAGRVLFTLIFFLSGVTQQMPTENLFIALVTCIGGGYILPDFILSTRVRARQERRHLALPDALELVVVCVEAGL